MRTGRRQSPKLSAKHAAPSPPPRRITVPCSISKGWMRCWPRPAGPAASKSLWTSWMRKDLHDGNGVVQFPHGKTRGYVAIVNVSLCFPHGSVILCLLYPAGVFSSPLRFQQEQKLRHWYDSLVWLIFLRLVLSSIDFRNAISWCR